MIGNLDSRMDLDEKIKASDEKYLGALAMMAAKMAYEHEPFVENVVKDHWKVNILHGVLVMISNFQSINYY